VQSLSDTSTAVSFGAIEEAIGQSLMEDDKEDLSVDLDAEDEGYERPAGEGIDFRFVDTEDDILATFRGNGVSVPTAEPNPLDRERLEGVLRDLIDCRQLLDRAMKDG
jgi:hypothetical protein